MTTPFIAVPSYLHADAAPTSLHADAAPPRSAFGGASGSAGVPENPREPLSPDTFVVPDFVPESFTRGESFVLRAGDGNDGYLGAVEAHGVTSAHESTIRDEGEGIDERRQLSESNESWQPHQSNTSSELYDHGAHGQLTAELGPPDRLSNVRDDTAELGPLAAFAEQAGVTDLFVNGDSGLWFDRGRGAEHAPNWSLDEAEVRELAVRLIARGGRHIDESTPCVDVRLGDGIRVHAVLPPISGSGTLLSIRLPSASGFDLAGLQRAGLFGEADAAALLAERLVSAVNNRENILVTGAAGSGKTTLLAALLGLASPSERIVTLEDVAELRIRHPHVVALEARQANLEGAGRLGLDTLLREALRMRPDRIVLGECRGSEIREMLAALNTGHDGGAGTLHANSLSDVPARIEALGALAGMSAEAIARQTVSAIGLVLHIEKRGGVRRLSAPGRFVLDENGRLAVRLESEPATLGDGSGRL